MLCGVELRTGIFNMAGCLEPRRCSLADLVTCSCLNQAVEVSSLIGRDS